MKESEHIGRTLYFSKAAGQNQTTHPQINQKSCRMFSNTQPTKTRL